MNTPGDRVGLPGQDLQLVQQLLENQRNELEHRSEQIDLEKQKDDHAFEFGKEALASQERDRKDQRDCRRNERKDQQKFVLLIVLIIGALTFGSIALGQAAVAFELVKSLALLAAGAFGGYGYAKRKPKDEDS